MVRFAGRDKLVHLIGNGEAPPRRWWGFAERLHRPVQAAKDFPDRNQAVSLFTLHATPAIRSSSRFPISRK